MPFNDQTEIRQVKVVEPTFLNANSCENCKEILRKIGDEAGIDSFVGKKGEWVIIKCNSLPF